MLFLSQTAEYALRSMAWLATAPKGEPVRASDLSVATGIPNHYLPKVLRRLVVANLLKSQKGQGGGFCLARAPEKIAFIEILSAVDAYPTEEHCAFGWGQCDSEDPCPLHHSWSQLKDQIREWAAGTSLDEILEYSRAGPRFASHEKRG
jgi:Rrf2 family protein